MQEAKLGAVIMSRIAPPLGYKTNGRAHPSQAGKVKPSLLLNTGNTGPTCLSTDLEPAGLTHHGFQTHGGGLKLSSQTWSQFSSHVWEAFWSTKKLCAASTGLWNVYGGPKIPVETFLGPTGTAQSLSEPWNTSRHDQRTSPVEYGVIRDQTCRFAYLWVSGVGAGMNPQWILRTKCTLLEQKTQEKVLRTREKNNSPRQAALLQSWHFLTASVSKVECRK